MSVYRQLNQSQRKVRRVRRWVPCNTIQMALASLAAAMPAVWRKEKKDQIARVHEYVRHKRSPVKITVASAAVDGKRQL